MTALKRVLSLSILVFLPVSLAHAHSVINCSTGDSIQAELDAGNLEVEFSGTCNEFVTITRDGTTIRGASGNPSVDEITQGLSVQGADDVLIEDVGIHGSSVGIRDGAYVTMRGSLINNTQNGFFVTRSSGATLIGNTFGPALDDSDPANTCAPICILQDATAILQDNDISGNTNNSKIGGALTVFRDASVRSRGGNRIRNTGSQPAISVFFNSDFRQDNISGSGADQVVGGLQIFGNSYYQLASGRIRGDVQLDLGSLFRYGGDVTGLTRARIQGDVEVSRDSSFVTDSAGLFVTGNINCADQESSFSGAVAGPGSVFCSGF